MKSSKVMLNTMLLLIGCYINAQDLSKHQWENRILVVSTDNTNTKEFQNQIKVLQNQEDGLKERRLLIYQISPTHYNIGILKDTPWIESSKLYQKLKPHSKSFEVLLIGLDGGIKLRQSNLLTIGRLFNTIDTMPMRRSEMRKNKNSKN